eukprot:scaffold32155_cov102-Phaeocystis_antarctica.AAC.2
MHSAQRGMRAVGRAGQAVQRSADVETIRAALGRLSGTQLQVHSFRYIVRSHVHRERARASQPRLDRAEIDAHLAHRTALHQIVEGRPPLMEPVDAAARWAQLAP